MSGCFAILPDEPPADGPARPLALFDNLEDALDWGSKRYSGGAFRIRYLEVIPIGDADQAS